jgi:hypothetical protein
MFYTRVKGELEEALRALPLTTLVIAGLLYCSTTVQGWGSQFAWVK